MGDKIVDEISTKSTQSELSHGNVKAEESSGDGAQSTSVPKKIDRIPKKIGTRRFSVESVNLQTSTISSKNDDVFLPSASPNPVIHAEEEDHFLDLLVRSQCSRMNDQRCSVDPLELKEKPSDKETIVDKSLSDLRLSLGDESSGGGGGGGTSSTKKQDKTTRKSENRRFSLENMNLLKYSPIKSTTDDEVFIPDGSTVNPVNLGARTSIHPTYTVNNSEEDHFLDLLVRFQGKRMNDQRCSLDPCKNKQ